jgi:DNA-binding response OmpR family regulator
MGCSPHVNQTIWGKHPIAPAGFSCLTYLAMKGNELLHAGEPAGASVQCQAHPRHRILVVDDDSDIRLLYTNALAHPGCRVDTAEDGATGWEAIQANYYNLLITEHSLPRLTGVELVRKVRAAGMAVPVVLTAIRLPAEELARNPSLQLAAVLPKPFYISELLETVKAVLRATDGAPEQISSLPDWRSQPSAAGLRL